MDDVRAAESRRRRRGWRRRGAALAALLCIAVSACGGGGVNDSDMSGGSSGDVDPNGTLRLMTTAVPTELDPHRETSGGARTYWFQVFDRLTAVDEHLEPQPMLATSWDEAPDGLSLTMQLRTGVTFHDGTPFDADAVVASIDRAKTLEGSKVADELTAITDVEVVGDHEVRFVLSEPMPELPALLSGPSGAMISPQAIADPETDLMTDPGDAGTGPYLVESFVPSEQAVYVRAPEDNWDPEAGKLERIEIVVAPDDRTRFSALRAGEADAIFVQPVFGDQVEEAMELGESDQYDHVATPSAALLALLLRTDVAPMDDPHLREAVIRSIDRDAIVEGYLRGTCTRSDQIVPEGFAGHVDDFEDPYPYDPEQAADVLADAGHADDLDLDVYVHAGRTQMPEIMQEQLAETGIDAEVLPLAAIEVYTTWIEGRAPAWFYQLTPEAHFLSTVADAVGPTGVGGGPSEEIAALVEQARSARDDERTAVYEDIARQFAEEAHLVPVCHPQNHYVVASDVVGFETAPSAYLNVTVDLRYVGRIG